MTNQYVQDYYADQYPMDEDYDFGIDGRDIDETDNYTPFPAGRYRLMATRVQLKNTRNGAGKMVAVEFQVAEGQHQGRKVFENYNLQHHNHQTVEIAQKQVKQWLIACGRDANQRLTMNLLRGLEGVEFAAHVGIEQDRSGQYPDQNRIKRYEAPFDSGSPERGRGAQGKPGEGGAFAPPAPPPQPPRQAAPPRQQPAQPQAGRQQPWRR
jgi:hypothetical protein